MKEERFSGSERHRIHRQGAAGSNARSGTGPTRSHAQTGASAPVEHGEHGEDQPFDAGALPIQFQRPTGELESNRSRVQVTAGSKKAGFEGVQPRALGEPT